jgi:hypothetical protein
MSQAKILLFLSLALFLIPSCSSLPHYRNQKTPREIVQIFMSAYGTSNISQIAPYTTAYFRNYKPEELWVIETWQVLSEYGYRHVSGRIIDEKIKGSTAIVITSSTIETLAGTTRQKEVYYLIKAEERWKLDELLIEEETVASTGYTL